MAPNPRPSEQEQGWHISETRADRATNRGEVTEPVHTQKPGASTHTPKRDMSQIEWMPHSMNQNDTYFFCQINRKYVFLCSAECEQSVSVLREDRRKPPHTALPPTLRAVSHGLSLIHI